MSSLEIVFLISTNSEKNAIITVSAQLCGVIKQDLRQAINSAGCYSRCTSAPTGSMDVDVYGSCKMNEQLDCGSDYTY